MNKIKIIGESFSTGIFNEEGEYLFREETGISIETWNLLQEWVKDYEPYTSKNKQDKLDCFDEILKLDERALELVRKIKEEWEPNTIHGEEIFVSYYSIGQEKFITI